MATSLFASDVFAHRGLHDAEAGIIENSKSAIQQAVNKGYGIEIDVQPSLDGCPMVFHDDDLHRLTGVSGLIKCFSRESLEKIPYLIGQDHISQLTDILRLIDGKVPLLIEVKSDWSDEPGIETALCAELQDYNGVCGVMSFDPAVLGRLKAARCAHPLGLVTTLFSEYEWPQLSKSERAHLSTLSDAELLGITFIAHDVRDLDSSLLDCLLARLDIELLSWTVRTGEELSRARQYGAAPIFEGAAILPLIAANEGEK